MPSSKPANESQRKIENSPNERQIGWFQNRLIAWGKEHLRDFPWRQTTNPYEIFVAEFLLQQTDAPRVIPVYQELLKKYPTLRDLANASVQEIAKILKPLGFHYRASRLQRAARILIEDIAFEGNIPNDEIKLLQLPGVGKYIAKSVCANAFGQPLAVLDTNISRIFQRFFGLQPRVTRVRDDPYFWEVTQRVAPNTNVGFWNLTLIDFGAAICTVKKPHCSECPLREQCKYFQIDS